MLEANITFENLVLLIKYSPDYRVRYNLAGCMRIIRYRIRIVKQSEDGQKKIECS